MELNKIYNESCLETMKRMPDNFIDLIITSPPYDNLRNYDGYDFDFKSIAKELYRATRQGGVVVWIVGDATINGNETGTSFKQALYFKDIGFNLHDTMIYQKTGFTSPESTRYYNVFEYMFVLVKNYLKVFNRIKDRKNIYSCSKSGTRRQKTGETIKTKDIIQFEKGGRFNVWKYDVGYMLSSTDKIAFQHPAIFPEKLAEDHIISWSNENDLVYDPMCGSGTVPKMAIVNNRKFLGSEISQKYYNIAQKRIKPLLQQRKLFK